MRHDRTLSVLRLAASIVFAAAVAAATDTVDLPSVDVTAQKPSTNAGPSREKKGLVLPEGVFGDEKSGGIVIFNEERGTAPRLGTGDRKNALFLIEYGLYDYLNSELTFENQFGPVSYLFSFNRRSEEDYYAAARRIYNSQNSLDNLDLNLQASSGRLANTARFQFLKDETGLQKNPDYYLQNKKIVLLSDMFSLGFGTRSRFELGLGYDYVEDGVKNNTSAVLAVYQKVKAQARWSATFSDVNSYYALARLDYEVLSHPSNRSSGIRAGVELYDNFMLWSLVGFDLKAGVFYQENSHSIVQFHLLPHLFLIELCPQLV